MGVECDTSESVDMRKCIFLLFLCAPKRRKKKENKGLTHVRKQKARAGASPVVGNGCACRLSGKLAALHFPTKPRVVTCHSYPQPTNSQPHQPAMSLLEMVERLKVAQDKKTYNELLRHDFQEASTHVNKGIDGADAALNRLCAYAHTHPPSRKPALFKDKEWLEQTVFTSYINEIWLGELGGDDKAGGDEAGATVELLQLVVRGQRRLFDSKFEGKKGDPRKCWNVIFNLAATLYGTFSTREPHNADDRMRAAIKAVREAVDQALGGEPAFSPKLACVLHQFLAQGLLDPEEHKVDPGSYRLDARQAGRGGSLYAPHDSIPHRIDALFCVTREHMPERLSAVANADARVDNLKKAVAVAAVFFRNFLLIHPFPDGNGRTARVLLSVLLAEHTLVPLSLYIEEEGSLVRARDAYIDMLAKCPEGKTPLSCIEYVLKCAIGQATKVERWTKPSVVGEDDNYADVKAKKAETHSEQGVQEMIAAEHVHDNQPKHGKKQAKKGGDKKGDDKKGDDGAAAKANKAALKEGGKKGQDLAGMYDMGGMKFFHVAMEQCGGNVDLLKVCCVTWRGRGRRVVRHTCTHTHVSVHGSRLRCRA